MSHATRGPMELKTAFETGEKLMAQNEPDRAEVMILLPKRRPPSTIVVPGPSLE